MSAGLGLLWIVAWNDLKSSIIPSKVDKLIFGSATVPSLYIGLSKFEKSLVRFKKSSNWSNYAFNLALKFS